MKPLKVKLFFFYLLFTFYYLLISAIGRIVFCFKAHIEILPYNIFDFQILRIDSATAAYLFLPILLSHIFFKIEIGASKIIKGYILLISIISLIIDYISGVLFTQWGDVLNARAFGYLAYEDGLKTIINEVKFSDTLSVITLSIMALMVSYYTIFRIQGYTTKSKYLWFLFFTPILVLVARGGLQKIPINSGVLFEKQPLAQNLCRLNKPYYLFQSLLKAQDLKKLNIKPGQSEYKIYPCEESDEHLKLDRPNIVLIVLEGISNEFFKIDLETEYSKQMPYLSKIEKEGLSFSNIYASGFRTDQGLLSLYSGIPTLPEINIMKELRAVDFKPSLYKSLKANNYSTSFFYGGDLAFSEMRRYLKNQQLDHLVGGNAIASKSSKLDWGFAEDVVFEAMLNHLDTVRKPFFTSCLTLTTHPPFDIVEKYGVDIISEEQRYIYSANKLDKYIENFMKKSSMEPWYENTLFVFVSDHGTMHLKNSSAEDHKRWHVPLFFYGEVLKDQYESVCIDTYGNHYDLPMTIENLLDIESGEKYRFSRDLFCENEDDSGYWASDHAYGFLTEAGNIVVQNNEYNITSNQQSDFDSLNTYNQFKALRVAIQQELFKR
jgi:phosphoglycerol transferase MdoB-like AlkP superfamily enzyme